jgi:hypothetical protein
VCCLLVLNLVSSTLSCIRQPRPRLSEVDHLSAQREEGEQEQEGKEDEEEEVAEEEADEDEEEEEEEEDIPEARQRTLSTLSSLVKQPAARNTEVNRLRFSMPGIQWADPEHIQQQPIKRRRIAPSRPPARAKTAFVAAVGDGESDEPDDGDYDLLARASDWRLPVCMQEEIAHGAPAFDGAEGDAWDGDHQSLTTHALDVSERESAATATLRGEDIELCEEDIERALTVGDDEAAAVAALAEGDVEEAAVATLSGCQLCEEDIDHALAVGDGEEAAVASTKSKAVKRTSIFGRRHNNKENKEPSPHIPPLTKWMTCWGTCKREFGWSVPSQQYYHAQNKKPPQFCDDCATQRHNNKRNLSWNTDK